MNLTRGFCIPVFIVSIFRAVRLAADSVLGNNLSTYWKKISRWLTNQLTNRPTTVVKRAEYFPL